MKLLIENLNTSTSSEDLAYLMGDLKGFIRSWIKTDNFGLSKGVGYASFESHFDGRQAIVQYNGIKMHGRKIKITQIRETSNIYGLKS
ncbi:MAG: hypothetical protein KDD50_12610 [Bdellovibrionales bacterium]|nr:hypothetical protein [Bdellovibrionales bacterium]